MAALYGETHRAMQDWHETRRLADLLEAAIIRPTLNDDDVEFLASRDFFFLATVDPEGRPTVSHKGGAPGFVRVLDASTLIFPLYDGNGMFLSAGNIGAAAHIGLLFIDFETPHRLRLQGEASLVDAEAGAFPGAVLLVRVALTHVFVNCGRYIHRHVRTAPARHVPDAAGQQPVPAWKRIDIVQGSLPARDQGPADEAGVITIDEYETMRRRGEV
jgi:predicted pyridoxine 5'-phosphate oxidase superfamily flavin-nucleotide-binding protein